MTTINNLSIEQMREIVDGAPDSIADTYVADTDTYFSIVFGSYFNHAEFDWLDSDYRSYSELKDGYETVFWLNDIRTAIAKHDEFKVGDLVVPIDWRYTLASGCCRYTHAFVVNTNPFQLMSEEGDMYWNCTVEAVGYRLIKTNVDLPIAVVNRMKREGLIKNFDTTDHVTDIRNHVSLNTRVVDL